MVKYHFNINGEVSFYKYRIPPRAQAAHCWSVHTGCMASGRSQSVIAGSLTRTEWTGDWR